MTGKRRSLAILIAAACTLNTTARADESASRYYEDDAWYDVSEWFDGNDYNPTDEAIGRWDDEKFQYADNIHSTDQDNDDLQSESNWTDYGYIDNSSDSDRWFYDYYDDGSSYWNNSDGWSSYTMYQDTDDDGVYDSYSYYADNDNDGIYEDFSYYSFDSTSQSDPQAKSKANSRQKDLHAKQEQISGTIDSTKRVDVRGKSHLVAHLKTEDGKALVVDLGPDQAAQKLAKGDKLRVTGHRVKVGDKSVLIAMKAQSKSSDLQIDRSGRKYTGTVASTREVKVQGQQHLLAKLKTENGKSMLVDLGPKASLSKDLREGQQITVQGVPVKVKERVVLMARKIGEGKNKTEIRRKSANSKI